ncbi:phosphate acyltransferase PlsX [Alloalcanivorax mobilis]|uniref:phosphate acyltransferase PlsX n=1 Tax=Alloalcanivorax mobilis TaxID=2019569 RepID=UPI000B5B14AF|nr:phosphate acyltransferase PlsX [Alloalcanivorax mobilis]ASK34362.1 phosphate acyltransferase [Alcanivorax sp. N3-2A]|tara:strand:+ start:71355 stop:72383 length:1029 start_codon:yes stop_codon:yes gene_type:complete
MSAVVTLAVDAMGGDHGLPVTVPAVARMLSRHLELRVILVGEPTALAPALKKEKLEGHPRLIVQPASEVVAMDDPVAVALRQKKDSSMRVTINQVKDGLAQAAVSAGNTGALMAVSRFVLKTLPGVDRPAICTAIPTAHGHCHMLDLGANVDSEPEHLLQFALMGQAVVRAVDGNQSPRVALLNIGEEDIKGNEQIKEAAALLQQAPNLNYAGFVEGNGIFLGDVDVVVCDGFVGNVSLKTMEGVAKMIGGMIREEADRSLLRKLSGLFALPLLRGLKRRMDPERYNGASLVGLNGVVVKSHGGTGVEGFVCALEVAQLEARRNVPALIKDALAPIDPAVAG